MPSPLRNHLSLTKKMKRERERKCPASPASTNGNPAGGRPMAPAPARSDGTSGDSGRLTAPARCVAQSGESGRRSKVDRKRPEESENGTGAWHSSRGLNKELERRFQALKHKMGDGVKASKEREGDQESVALGSLTGGKSVMASSAGAQHKQFIARKVGRDSNGALDGDRNETLKAKKAVLNSLAIKCIIYHPGPSHHPGGLSKKVVWADAVGLDLTQVAILSKTEPESSEDIRGLDDLGDTGDPSPWTLVHHKRRGRPVHPPFLLGKGSFKEVLLSPAPPPPTFPPHRTPPARP